MEHCAGCSLPGEPVCRECRELVSRGVEVRADRILVRIAGGLCLLFAAGVVWGIRLEMEWGAFAARVWAGSGFGLAVSGAWLWRELCRIRLVRFAGGELLLMDGLGRRRRVPLEELTVADGRVRARSRGEAWLVGEVRFPGAAGLHRALRAALALRSCGAWSSPIC